MDALIIIRAFCDANICHSGRERDKKGNLKIEKDGKAKINRKTLISDAKNALKKVGVNAAWKLDKLTFEENSGSLIVNWTNSFSNIPESSTSIKIPVYKLSRQKTATVSSKFYEVL